MLGVKGTYRVRATWVPEFRTRILGKTDMDVTYDVNEPVGVEHVRVLQAVERVVDATDDVPNLTLRVHGGREDMRR